MDKNSSTGPRSNDKSWFARLLLMGIAAAATLIFGLMIVVVTGLIAILSFGKEDLSDISFFEGSALLFWFTVWGLIATAVVYRILKDKQQKFWKYSRRTFIICALPLLIVSAVATAGVFVYSSYEDNSARSCDMVNQLNSARSATYSIVGSSGSGSAVAISSDGKLLTAHHVIAGEQNLKTYVNTPNNSIREVPVVVLQEKPEYDLALLQIEASSISYLNLASTSLDMSGEDVYAIGFPGNAFQAGHASVSKGIFSRLIESSYGIEAGLPSGLTLVQTDAAINPGSSGGALISKCGLIGINSAISTSNALSGLPREEGIGYAISAETIKSVFDL